MALLHDAVKGCPGVILGEDIHALIETARHSHEDDEIWEFVYEKRVLAETMISRPVMKEFKGMIRAEGGGSLRYGWFEFPRFESCQFIQTILEFTFI